MDNLFCETGEESHGVVSEEFENSEVVVYPEEVLS